MSNVEHPKHYNFSKIEVIDVIDQHFQDFYFGNVFKYISRAKMKNGTEDMKKSKFYLERLKKSCIDNGEIEHFYYHIPQLIIDFIDTDYFSSNHKKLIMKLFGLSEYYKIRNVIHSELYEEYNSLFHLVLNELQA